MLNGPIVEIWVSSTIFCQSDLKCRVLKIIHLPPRRLFHADPREYNSLLAIEISQNSLTLFTFIKLTDRGNLLRTPQGHLAVIDFGMMVSWTSNPLSSFYVSLTQSLVVFVRPIFLRVTDTGKPRICVFVYCTHSPLMTFFAQWLHL